MERDDADTGAEGGVREEELSASGSAEDLEGLLACEFAWRGRLGLAIPETLLQVLRGLCANCRPNAVALLGDWRFFQGN